MTIKIGETDYLRAHNIVDMISLNVPSNCVQPLPYLNFIIIIFFF